MSKFREKDPIPPRVALTLLAAVTAPMLPLLAAQAQVIRPSNSSQSVSAGIQTELGEIAIDGDPSLKPTTQALNSSFEEQFPDSQINYESQGSDAAVTGVISGRLDIAAIGRSLTPLEQQAGVATVSLPREKIATFVGVENPFRGDISHQQFAQIFRGEITNWAELGGEDIPIRFVDLAADSDTRRALETYGIFQSAAFQNGETAITQSNNISSVIENLGHDGLGYGLFEQVKNRSEIRLLPMHGVMPTDARYPFSQPRGFAYLGDNPTPEAIAFLNHVSQTIPEADLAQGSLADPAAASEPGFGDPAQTSEGDRPVGAAARSAVFGPVTANSGSVAGQTLAAGSSSGNGPNSGAAGSQNASAASLGNIADEASNSAPDGAVASRTVRYRPSIMDTIHAPWWWLLPLLPLGVIGAAALRRRNLNAAKAQDLSRAAATGSASVTPVPLSATAGTIANDEAAGFALKTPHHQTVSGQDIPQQAPIDPSLDKALKRPDGGKKAVPMQGPGRGQTGRSPEMQYSNPKPSAGAPAEAETALADTALGKTLQAGLGAAGIAGATALTGAAAKASSPEIPQAQGPASRLAAPMAGVGNSDNEQTWITLTPLNSHQGEVNWHLSAEHRLQAKQQGGRRMMIRIHDADPSSQPEQWLPSNRAYECSSGMDRKQVDFPLPDRDYVAELGFLTNEEEWIHIARSVHSHSPTPEYDGCRVVIMPCDPHRQMHSGPTRHPKPQAYVYWDIALEFKRRLRKQGGQMLVLRIYDADRIDLDQQQPHHTDEYVLDENARDKVVTVPVAEHDYVAEIGYLTIAGEFLSLGRSAYAHIPVAAAHQ